MKLDRKFFHEISILTSISHTVVFLFHAEQCKLLNHFNNVLPQDWEKIARHMTIGIGIVPEVNHLLGQDLLLQVTSFGINDKIAAVGVEPEVSTGDQTTYDVILARKSKTFPRRKLSFEPSDNIKNWKIIDPFVIKGTVGHVDGCGNVWADGERLLTIGDKYYRDTLNELLELG